ncbi:MAG TPA: N-acetyl-gamma-glutamyl-phosphate reductase [Acidimicrobiales bacterium]|jgi:N-acetyl-gamma-glutamyl-phosphate reductase|nr:N-acetyl-gamma-glutamyl-phosphate reductase [Acidimicrobiales bacterium]
MAKVGIIGGSGFTGAELLRLLAAHPGIEVVAVTGDTQAGAQVADLYPSLRGAYGDLTYLPYAPEMVEGLDLLFCGLPHGASQAMMPDLLDRVAHVVDLAADFRLASAGDYPTWYGEAHTAPELLSRFAYGLPELHRDEIVARGHVAVPGCYPTAAILALWPLVHAGLVDTTGIIVDAASGVSGAGRAPKPTNAFCAVDEDFVAYGVGGHRHTPEMEQQLGATVLFTPHLAPMNRGILATCYARPAHGAAVSTESLRQAVADAWADEPFVVPVAEPPHTKATLGANTAQVNAVFDDRTGHVIAMAAIDNLTKGASGGAVQCANLLLGLDETMGLPTVGMMP